MADFEEVVNTRRSIREYDSKEVGSVKDFGDLNF